ncbi:hypothetical protein ACSQ67_024913 [Phaseolus vulgaris]
MEQLNKSVMTFNSATMCRNVLNLESEPMCVKLGNHDCVTLQMENSPDFLCMTIISDVQNGGTTSSRTFLLGWMNTH